MNNEDRHRDEHISSDPLRPHAHDPNPAPPTDDPNVMLTLPNGTQHRITVDELSSLPVVMLQNCFIVSTGHGTSGPFHFAGPTLYSLVGHYLNEGEQPWSQVEVISADGFGTRISAEELQQPSGVNQIILACTIDGQPMARQQGLVRLIVPTERDDALRQVKWIGTINVW